MLRKIRQKDGFTLIEMLIAMSIFIIFTGIIINSYTSIIKSQRDANGYRVMYSEARHVFDTLVLEFRDGMLDYGHYKGGALFGNLIQNDGDAVYLISKDASSQRKIVYDAGDLLLSEGPFWESPVVLNGSGVKLADFAVYVSPSIDPYDQRYVNYDKNQFHPKITIYAEFEMETITGKVYTMDLQTTVSSRVYNQVYNY